MGWGQQRTAELAEVVRTYISSPTTGNMAKLKAALEEHDRKKMWLEPTGDYDARPGT